VVKGVELQIKVVSLNLASGNDKKALNDIFQRPGNTVTNANDGHTINFQMELIGCENYNLDESK
jgi:hypothetical protein